MNKEHAELVERLRNDRYGHATYAGGGDCCIPPSETELKAATAIERLSKDNERLAEQLEEIERQCVQADDPEHHTLGLIKNIARTASNSIRENRYGSS